MKKYSTTYPLVFGIICVIVGLAVGQIGIVLLFGVLPIVLSLILKRSERKAKKQGYETHTEWLNRTYQETQNATGNNRQPKKACCTRCGIDLSLLPLGTVRKINEKLYCDLCGKIVLKSANNGTSPKTEPEKKKITASMAPPKKKKPPIPAVSQPSLCARCKKVLAEDKTVWIGSHRFCADCAAKPGEVKQPENPERTARLKTAKVQALVNVLVQIQAYKKGEARMDICTVCRRPFPGESLIFVDGAYYCEDCYSFTYEKDNGEASSLPQELYQISYEISGIENRSLLSCVVDVADRLIAGGFAFCKANVGGGVTETGVMAYDAVYTDYDLFKRNMERDFQTREQAEREKSGGWISGLHYSHIAAFLSRGALKAYIFSEHGHIVLRWIDASDRAFAVTRVFAESVIEEVYDNRCTLQQIDNMELRSAFLRNWS